MKRALVSVLLFVPLWVQADSVLRDPTRPPTWEQGAVAGLEGGLRLEAIKRGQGRPLATLSGQSLRVGDEIDGMRLIRIGESSVLLEGPEGRKELRLTPTVERSMRPKSAAGGK